MIDKIQFVRDVDVKGKRVFVRVDFNVPLDDSGKVSDTTRLEAALPTINYLSKEGAKVILASHLGRPKPDHQEEHLKMDEVAKSFSKVYGKKVPKIDCCIGGDAEEAVAKMKDGDVLLLENIRFYEGERRNDAEFCNSLAKLADLFVNDAFGTAHRKHASTAGLADCLPSYAGFLLEKEIQALSPLLEAVENPCVFICGGVKIDTKIGVLKTFANKADSLLVGGALANTFLYAEGFDVGDSMCEQDKMEIAQEIMLEAEKNDCMFMVPEDAIVADDVTGKASALDIPIEDVEMGMRILDIGSLTIQKFVRVILDAKTIIWNGPVGLYEMKPFSKGTQMVADAVKEATKNGAVSILGGGDTVDAIKKFGHKFDEFTHVSTGGGAMLEFVEGKTLPGIAAVMKK